jgi:hypothetical protein
VTDVAHYVAACMILVAAREALIAVVVGVGLRTNDAERRMAALCMLRLLKSGILPRRSEAGESE